MIAVGAVFFPPYQHNLILLEGMGHSYSWVLRKREDVKVECGCIWKAPFITSAQCGFRAAKKPSVVSVGRVRCKL